MSPFSGAWSSVPFFFGGEISPLLLSKKIEGLEWRNRKIDEMNGTGDQNKQIKSLGCVTCWGALSWD